MIVNTYRLYFGFLLIISSLGLSLSADKGVFAAENKKNSEIIQILALGDSLTAGYGLGPGDGFTEKLEKWLNANTKLHVKVINAGVSGDTSSGGRSRLDWALAPVKGGKPDLVIVELGANDGLRGIDPNITHKNIDAIVGTLKSRGVEVLIAGMQAPPNLGPDYAAVFNNIFTEMAAKYDVPLYPFFLEGVATIEKLNQSDGLHPNSDGVDIIVEQIGPVVASVLTK